MRQIVDGFNDDNFDAALTEREQRDSAIAAAHHQLLAACHMDKALSDAGAQKTYRYTQSIKHDFGSGVIDFIKIDMKPMRPVLPGIPESDIERITLEMPIKPWDQVEDFIHDMHLMQFNDYKSTLGEAAIQGFAEPLYAPDQIVLFKAYRGTDAIQGAIFEGEYGAISSIDDIQTIPAGSDGGMDYAIARHCDTSYEQTRLQAQYFETINDLTYFIDQCEPMPVGSWYNSDSAA